MPGGVSVASIYHELIAQGASTVEALGIMANMISESGFNTQAVGDQGTSFGLVQQHGNYSYLVTGNPQQDMVKQIQTLKSLGGFSAASGNTPQEAAGNFAANYERCVGCQPGGAQYNGRVANAAKVVGYFKSGKWPNVGGGANPGNTTQQASLTSFPGGAWDPLNIPEEVWKTLSAPVSGAIGTAGALEGVWRALSGVAADFNTIVHDIEWLFVPGHWVRIGAFVAGTVVLVPGLVALGKTGQGGVSLPVGIALITLSAILYFVAFHNLDPTIHDLRSLLASISAQIRGEPHAVAAAQ
jgi:uncharacterized protein YoaH (UPF0181 family)